MKPQTPAKQLAAFLKKYTPEVAATARAALRKIRVRLPGATEMVYDNYNALVIAFGPTDRASEAIFSIALYPRWVNLFFVQGAKLPDPDKILKGSGNLVRRIEIRDASELDKPEVRAVMRTAMKLATKPIDPSARRRLIIKSVSAKQRPRRP
jgi:Domain of unknown function (DU1801)